MTMTKVVKRDGTQQDFDTERISGAIRKAARSMNMDVKVEEITKKVVGRIQSEELLPIENIQDVVEQELMNAGYYEVVKHYILYRNEKKKQRDLGVLNLKNLPDIQVPWGNGMSYITYARTYKRNEDQSFKDTILRVLVACQKQLHVGFSQDELKIAYEHLMNLRGSVAGRFLWTLGTETVSRHGLLSLQNCAFVKYDNAIRTPCWVKDCLMLGCGVGVNVQKHNVDKIPSVLDMEIQITRKDTKDADFIVPDSREGWCSLLEKVMESFFYRGNSFTYSTFCIRNAGSQINGFGGVASGADVLCDGIHNICKVLRNRRGKKLRPVDCMDIIDIIGSIVVAGNVRRCLPKGALVHTLQGLVPIEKVSVNDKVIASDGKYYRVSDIFYQGRQKLVSIQTEQGVFQCTANHRMAVIQTCSSMPIWKPACELKQGDMLATTRLPILGKATTFLPSFQEQAPLQLDADMAWFLGLYSNHFRLCDKINGFEILCPTIAIAQKVKEQVQRIEMECQVDFHKLEDNQFLVVSNNHKDLFVFLSEQCRGDLPVFIREASLEIRKSFIAGVADSEISSHLVCCQSKSWAMDVQRLCYSCGFETRYTTRYYYREKITYHLVDVMTDYARSVLHGIPLLHNRKIYEKGCYDWLLKRSSEKGNDCLCASRVLSVCAKDGEEEETFDITVEDKHEFFCDGYLTHNSAIIVMGDMDDVEYMNAKRWDLGCVPNYRAMSNNSVICNDIHQLPESFWEGYKGNGEPYGLINLNLARRIGRIKDGDKYPDPEVDGFNPCAEQSLANFETCCLAELFLPNIESYEQLQSVATILYRICKHSLLLPCHHRETEKIVHKNMRMGIGVSGWLQSTAEQKDWMSTLYEYLRKYDVEYSNKLGVPTSIKITTCKPSGTLSLLPGITPGCHPAIYKYYIRRIRIAATNPLVELCRQHGYHIEPQLNFDGSFDTKTMVVEFPCKADEKAVLAENMSAIDQLEVMKDIQTRWSDNSVSISCYYRKEELPTIREWLKKNYNDHVKTVSFILHYDSGFKQMPYENISKEQYEELIQKVQPITDGMIDTDDTDASLECAGGKCPVK